MPKLSLFDDEEQEDTPSLYENIKDDIAFKVKVAKKERELKSEMKQRELARQKQREKLKKFATTK